MQIKGIPYTLKRTDSQLRIITTGLNNLLEWNGKGYQLFNSPNMAVLKSKIIVQSKILFESPDIGVILSEKDWLKACICIPNMFVPKMILLSGQEFFESRTEELGIDISSLKEKNAGSVMCFPLSSPQAGDNNVMLGTLILWSFKQNHFDPLVHLEVGQSFADQISRALKKLQNDQKYSAT